MSSYYRSVAHNTRMKDKGFWSKMIQQNHRKKNFFHQVSLPSDDIVGDLQSAIAKKNICDEKMFIVSYSLILEVTTLCCRHNKENNPNTSFILICYQEEEVPGAAATSKPDLAKTAAWMEVPRVLLYWELELWLLFSFPSSVHQDIPGKSNTRYYVAYVIM